MITLTTYAEAKDAFRCRDLRQALYDEGGRLMTGVIVNLHGDAHIARRRLENRLFRRDTFAWYERDRIPGIIDDVLRRPIEDGHGDLLPLARRTMMRLSVDVAGVDVAGADHSDPGAADTTDRRFERLYDLMDRLARASTVAHATGDKATIIDAGDRALAEFECEFFEPSRARRAELVAAVDRGDLDPAALPRDVLTTLLSNHDRLDLPAETVLREVAYFPWVGSHSTSAQLVHAMHHLFDCIAGGHTDRDRLAHDDVLRQRFVHESMRLHPASPVAMRVALTGVTLKSGRHLPAGARVAIDVERANRDPDVFGDAADDFDPDRELPDGVPPWGLSFGHGSHACLGQELAGGLDVADAADHHLLGAVAIMAGVMLRAGARPDPEDPAVLDETTTRTVWGRYPVRFERAR